MICNKITSTIITTIIIIKNTFVQVIISCRRLWSTEGSLNVHYNGIDEAINSLLNVRYTFSFDTDKIYRVETAKWCKGEMSRL